MAESATPQELKMGALNHFENGVPICDLYMRREHKERLARVEHVYWQWVKNPFIDVFVLFKMLVKGKGADLQSEWRMAQKDKWLFDFVVDHVSPSSRRKDEMKVRAAAEKTIMIGMETDNVQALTKGGKLLYDLAGLDKPESEKMDFAKAVFLPAVVTTSAKDFDPTKEEQTDEQGRLIMDKYKAHVDDKRKAVDEKVAMMMAMRNADGIADSEAENIPETLCQD